jgi:uncharacterized protein (DUF433 family)
MNYHDRIIRDPQIVGGEPVLKGTRVTLKTVRAVIAFAAASAQEDLPLAETPVKR